MSDNQRFKDGNRYISQPDIPLLEFWEIGSSNRHRAAQNNEDVTSNSETYAKSNIQINLPSASDTQQEASISISNVSMVPGRTALSAKKRIQVRLMNSSGLDRDTLLQDTLNMMVLKDVTVDPRSVSGTLAAKADPLMPYPFSKTGATTEPGLFLE